LDRVQALTRVIQSLQTELKSALENHSIDNKRAGLGAGRDGQKQGTKSRVAATSQPGPVTNSDVNRESVHALLCERMAELQDDRRSRIQRMMDFLSGK
jgi:hypothetical protein